nr:nuclear pore complex protein NUP62-like [Quercus suber]
MQTQHLAHCVFQMEGSQTEMDVALFNWCWVLQSEAELQTDNVVGEVNLENMVDNIHDRRLEVCMNSEFIEGELEQMTEQIKSLIQTLNANQGGELEAVDGMTPLDVVVRILNNQLSSLMWVDEKADEFSSHIQKIASQGSAADCELMGPKFWKS